MTSRSVPPENAPHPPWDPRSESSIESLLGPETWCRALELARFLQPCDEQAMSVAVLAVSRLDRRLRMQNHRRHYRPRGRRTKVVRSPLQMLQQLVFEASDDCGRLDERTATTRPSAEVLLRRYVTFLVHSGARRNALHVVIAICSLLYRFTTRETLAVFDDLASTAATTCDEAYLRSRKKLLLGEAQERFETLLDLQPGRRGALRFHGGLARPAERDTVRQTLETLIPWGTSCDRSRRGGMAQIHRLVHPPCFDRLVRTLGLDTARLWIPEFSSLRRAPGV